MFAIWHRCKFEVRFMVMVDTARLLSFVLVQVTKHLRIKILSTVSNACTQVGFTRRANVGAPAGPRLSRE